MKNNRYIFKPGDARDAYVVGEKLTVKWNISYTIKKVEYDAEGDHTSILLSDKPIN